MSHIMPHPPFPLHVLTTEDLFKVNSARLDQSLHLGFDIELFDTLPLPDESELERLARSDAAADLQAEADLYSPYGEMDVYDLADVIGIDLRAFPTRRRTAALVVAA
ncbi:hypothetical protein [Kitasatospora kifunensis]|uniref:Uncharacterized protein n=1 Tax=Kitasatospora kifunensis TaxID=58351 RepID=A0A7W7RBQ3_KITKI|nr:hypothetical protein [Kitasatospora kifunensis]MBB4929027.1 hypothetical protein [Kitasatospora kifunensis]